MFVRRRIETTHTDGSPVRFILIFPFAVQVDLLKKVTTRPIY
jgi:hypothetical protein